MSISEEEPCREKESMIEAFRPGVTCNKTQILGKEVLIILHETDNKLERNKLSILMVSEVLAPQTMANRTQSVIGLLFIT